jgi:beta-lactamase regulating signal transducer with metallopeptidase domain/predicted  nucleic acid-binding Zn-ribbon protein
MTAFILESAFRTLIMAAAVWCGIRLLRVHSVVVQKTAWCLVLFSAFAMPALMRWQVLQSKSAVVVPVHHLITETAASSSAADVAEYPATSPLVTIKQSASIPAKHWSAAQWRDLVVPVYWIVCAVLLLRLAIGSALALRIWHRAEPASVLVDPRANIRISEDLKTPVTIGSTIVLPESHTEWDQRKLHMVLAHERSHVHQFDFYLQMLAGVYAALFWFSPVGWWLKKELSDLGEAISDRAALAEAQSRATYAEVLVEFAAMPRKALAGVAMARSSNIRRRIDRLLIEQKFRGAFTSSRWHYAVAAMLVPVALVAAVALVRVQTAEALQLPQIVIPRTVVPSVSTPVLAKLPVIHKAAALAGLPAIPREVQSATSTQTAEAHGRAYLNVSDDGENSYAIVSGNSSVSSSGYFGESLEKARKQMHGGNYIVFERDGKSYIIDDPTLVAESKQLFQPIEELGRRQGELGKLQGQLGAEQGRLGALEANASAPSPDLSKEIANLQEELKKLQDHQQLELKQIDLSAIQAKIGDLQAKIGDVQARIGEKQAGIGSQQAALGEKQAKLGEQQAALGREQARLSEEASRKMKSLIDSAMQNGNAKPIE